MFAVNIVVRESKLGELFYYESEKNNGTALGSCISPIKQGAG